MSIKSTYNSKNQNLSKNTNGYTRRSIMKNNLIFCSNVLSKAATRAVLLVSIGLCAPLSAKTIEWPADSVQWRASELPGYSLALQKCSTCHSAHYAEYQPPSAASGYWKAQVLRMKNVFKAPLSEEEAQSVVDYLSQTYGAARK